MAKKLENSDLSGKLFEERIGLDSFNMSFDKIMRYKESGKYLLFTYFVCTKEDPRSISLNEILNTSNNVKNIILQQLMFAKKMKANYFVHVIAPTSSILENISKIIAFKDIDFLTGKLDFKEKIFNNKTEYNIWFNELNEMCGL